MTITVVSVGTKPPPNLQHQIDEFLKRLPASLRVEWRFVLHSAASDALTSKQQESEKILSTLPDGFCILLDERGKEVSSEQFSSLVFEKQHKNISFIIGGAYGVSEAVAERADQVISLSKLVFPHQLVRVLLAEQLYRAYCIHTNHPYHHS